MVTKVFQLLLLLSPIVIGANIDMDVFDLIFFRTGVIILFGASLLDVQRRQMPVWVNKIILSLLGLSLANIFLFTFAPQVLATTMNLFLGVIGFYILYNYLDEKADFKKYIITAAMINLAFLIFQRIGFDPIFDHIPEQTKSMAGAFFGNKARLANYFALIMPFAPIVLIPAGLVVFLSTGQFVLLIPITLLILIRLKTVKSKSIFLAVLLAVSILLRKHILTSIHTRLDIWYPALQAYFDQPLIGYGLGTKVLGLDAYFNSYLSFILGVGIMGLVWFGYVFREIKKHIEFNQKLLPLLILGLLMLVEYPIEVPRDWYIILFILVMSLLKGKTCPINVKCNNSCKE